jgi:hypothetical protein
MRRQGLIDNIALVATVAHSGSLLVDGLRDKLHGFGSLTGLQIGHATSLWLASKFALVSQCVPPLFDQLLGMGQYYKKVMVTSVRLSHWLTSFRQ